MSDDRDARRRKKKRLDRKRKDRYDTEQDAGKHVPDDLPVDETHVEPEIEMAYQLVEGTRVWMGTQGDDAPSSPRAGDVCITHDTTDLRVYSGETWIQHQGVVAICLGVGDIGKTSDAAEVDPSENASLIGLAKGLLSILVQINVKLGAGIPVTINP